MRLASLSALLTFLPSTSAAIDSSSTTCFNGCKLSLGYVAFSPRQSSGGADFVEHVCANELARRSVAQCAHVYCRPEVLDKGIKGMNESCARSGAGGFERFDLVEGGVRTVKWEEGGLWTEVVIPDEDFFQRGYWTEYATVYVHARHVGYSGAMFVYWCAVILLGTSYRLLGFHLSTTLKPTDPDSWPVPPSPPGPSTWLRRFIVLPATFGYKNAQPFGWYTVPPRVQSLTILAFILINVWFTVHGYYFSDMNLYFPSFKKQAWRYIADRTGFISYANFPLVWVFGLRNNLLLWLTGWDFGTYNNFHRWVARVATIHAIIHSIGYTVLVFMDGGWTYFCWFFSQFFWWTATIATIAMSALLVLSLFCFRRNYYESFLLLHILLSVVTLYCMWAHLTIFNGRFDPIIWMCCAAWIGDRLGRALRILAFNPLFWNTKASVQYNKQANIVRLSVPCNTALYRPREGSFYYIYLLDDCRFWESHPFTVATVPVSRSFADQQVATLDGDSMPLLADRPAAEAQVLAGPVAKEMTFLIRPYNGFTDRLKNKVLDCPRNLRIIVEGPYGHTAPLERFATCLFVVGGSGIVVPLSHLAKLANACRPVRIVWAVGQVAFAKEVLARDFSRLGASFEDGRVLSLDVYVTAGDSRLLKAPLGVRVFDGRPDVRKEVEGAMGGGRSDVRMEVEGARGGCAVMACGPGVMADEARAAVVEGVARGYEVEYFEEAFNW